MLNQASQFHESLLVGVHADVIHIILNYDDSWTNKYHLNLKLSLNIPAVVSEDVRHDV